MVQTFPHVHSGLVMLSVPFDPNIMIEMFERP
jgi:hypothetical protein